MKIKKLYGENIYSFSKFSVDFMDYSGVISIILGKNLDQKTANGAGKTSILKSLYWAMWNKELNGATVDEMVNRTNPSGGMLTVLEFEDRGYEYKITRYKSYKPNKNSPKLHDGTVVSGSGVEFLVNGEPLMAESPSKTQLIIEQKIRMTPRLFLSCVLMAQNAKNSFLTANDTEKKELLSELLDLQAYEKAFKSVKDSIKEVEDRIATNENKIETLNEQIENNKKQLLVLEQNETSYETEVQDNILKHQKEITSLKQSIELLKQIAEQKDLSDKIKSEILEVEEKIKNNQKELSTELEISNALSILNNEIKNSHEKNMENTSYIQEKNKKVINISDQDLLLIDSELNSINVNLQEITLQLSNKRGLIEAIEDELNSNQKSFIELNNDRNKLGVLNKELLNIENHIKEAQSNSLCPTCLRQFNEGENSSLDNLLKNFNEKYEKTKESVLITQENILKKELLLLDHDKQTVKLKIIKDEIVKLEEEKSLLLKKENELRIDKNNKQSTIKTNKEIELEIISKNNEILNIEKNIKKLLVKKDAVEKLLESLIPLKKETIELEESIKNQREELKKQELKKIEINQAKKELDEKNIVIKNITENIEVLKGKQNPYSQMKKNIQVQLETFNERMEKHKTIVKDSQEEIKYLNFWKVGFAPVGIRSFITDDVIELLNRKTQENLNDLFDGAISVMFDPESKNNKGIVSNKISTVFIQNGKETSFFLLSGGEQQRAILATELALTEVAEARAGTKLNIRFLDEPFTGMDNNGQIKSLSLFARIAREKDGFFVISHDENFQHLCQKAMFVVKNKEISYIVDRNKFNNASIDMDLNASSGFEEGENLDIAGKPVFDFNKAIKKKKQKEDEEDD